MEGWKASKRYVKYSICRVSSAARSFDVSIVSVAMML